MTRRSINKKDSLGSLFTGANPDGEPGRVSLSPAIDSGPGFSEKTAEFLASARQEPAWLREHRTSAVRALRGMDSRLPWGPPELDEIPFGQLHYYSTPAPPHKADVNQMGDERKSDGARKTELLLKCLGVYSEQRNHLAGTLAQIDSEVVHRNLRKEWEAAGVVFVDARQGLTRFAHIFRPYFGTIVSANENVYARLNAAFFSGGAFIYIPPGVRLAAPLKCFMHLQAESGTQFGRTLVVADAESELTLIESCSSLSGTHPALHCSVGEFIAQPGATIRYIGLQNWTRKVFNLVIARALVASGANIQWIDCNLGGRLTMKYPCAILAGDGAHAEATSIAVAQTGQRQDSGAKMIHRASHTSSVITSKSVSAGEGRADYRGRVDMAPDVHGCRNHTECDALLIDESSRTDTYPAVTVAGKNNVTQHEATVSRLDTERMFYMQQRGLTDSAVRSLSVNGFVNDLVERFPLEYSVRIRRLIDLHMEGSVG